MEDANTELPHCLILGSSPFFYSAPFTAAEKSMVDRPSHPRLEENVLSNTGSLSDLLIGSALFTGILSTLGASYFAFTGQSSKPPELVFGVWAGYVATAAMAFVGIRLYERNNNGTR